MKKLAYDLEIFPNFFCACFEDCKTNDKFYFEISPWRNDRVELQKFIKGNWLLGYNNMMYDNPILNYILKKDVNNEFIYIFSQEIIRLGDNGAIHEFIKPYKYNKDFISVDIMRLLFAKMLRVSLKALQVSINWHNVLECPLDFNQPIKETDRESIKYYCENDVSSTKQLILLNKDKINLRVIIEKQFGLHCLSKDDVRTGVDLFANFYEKDSGNNDFLKKRTHRNCIILKDIISDKIKFNSKQFNELLNAFKKLTIVGTKGVLEYSVIYDNVKYVYGTGGIHSDDKPGILIPKEDEFLIDIDVALNGATKTL